MQRGKIARLVSDRGFGFIRPEQKGKDVWFHANTLEDKDVFPDLEVGMEVEFESRAAERGPQAVKVLLIGAPQLKDGGPGYRFLNPYNFVRFLTPPGEGTEKQPETALATQLKRLGHAPSDAKKSPESLLFGKCAPPPHDRYVGITGKISCTLEAVTPLFIADSHDVSERNRHKSYRFFRLRNDEGKDEVALPATSLRGMVRAAFEAATNSCMTIFTGSRMSRHEDPGQARLLVPARVEPSITSESGLRLRLLPGRSELAGSNELPAAWVHRYAPIRSSRSALGSTEYASRDVVDLGDFKHGSQCWAAARRIKHPTKNFHFWNVIRLAGRAEDLNLQNGEEPIRGYLCITNQNIENKHDERFFFEPDPSNPEFTEFRELDMHVVRNYHDLIDDYQKRHRDDVQKRTKPEDPYENERGKVEPGFSRFLISDTEMNLEVGALVYAQLKGEADVEYIAPVSVPRVAYNRSSDELLHTSALPCDRPGELCSACRVFGWVEQKPEKSAPGVAFAGRVEFSAGRLGKNCGVLETTPLAILSSPKPTTTAFYLTSGDYNAHNNWLRGRKVYRHHGKASEKEYRRFGDVGDHQNRTACGALKPGATFRFTIHFSNLAPVELGALLWTLEMDGQGVHRLGCAKPLGFGSVKIRVDADGVKVLDPAVRYSSDQAGWRFAENWKVECVEKFKTAMAERYRVSGFEELGNIRDIRSLLADPPDALPVHYPRTERVPTEKGENFKWFMGNKKADLRLLDPPDDTGFPLLTESGVKVK
ncbi:MAG: TIGR03986 family type III CRISPR-associated RAMP protein [Acidobacteriota bacterium]